MKPLLEASLASNPVNPNGYCDAVEGFYVRQGVCYSDHCLLQVLALVLLQLYFVGHLLLSNIVNMYCNRFNLLIISDLYNSCLTTFLQPLTLFSVCAYRIE
jgi:hypothetical protein